MSDNGKPIKRLSAGAEAALNLVNLSEIPKKVFLGMNILLGKGQGQNGKRKPVEEITLSARGLQEIKDAVIGDWADKSAENLRLKSENQELRGELYPKKTLDPEKELKDQLEAKRQEILIQGLHSTPPNKTVVIGKDSEPIGGLISMIHFRGADYLYFDHVEYGKVLWGMDSTGTTHQMGEIVKNYHTFHSQLKHNYLTINFDKGGEYYPDYVVVT